MNNLNPAQAQAARHIDGPLLILAGAGTGKTQTMISRLVYLISQVGIPDENILVLTFTNKAAASMNARAQRMLANAGFAHANRAVLSTFHSWGMNFLSENIQYCRYKSPNFRIIDDADQADLIKEATRICLARTNYKEDFALKTPGKDAALLSSEKEMLKESFQQAKAAIAMAKSSLKMPNDELLIAIYKEYELQLNRTNLIDFDDLILLPIYMLKENPQLLASTQLRYQYIMVDEYQDTNIAQLQLLKLLAGEAKNIVVVGDDDQSIYSFRHATVDNILGFERDFPGAQIIKLEQNYRSTKTILDAANNLISFNQFRHGKTLFSQLEDGEEIEILNSSDEIVRNIQALIKNGVNPEEIAIIYRLNMLGNFLEPKLISAKINYRVIGQIAFFMRSEIKLVLSYIRLWLNPLDNQAFIKCINAPRRGFGEAALLRLKQLSLQQQNPSLLDTLRQNITAYKNSSKLKAFVDLFDSLGSFGIFINKLKALDLALIYDDYQTRAGHIAEFFNILQKACEPDFSHERVFEFLNQIALASENAKNHEPGINMLSIHAAKGLEFDYVFIAGAESRYMPSPQAFGAEQLEEERRLMYVAITRARKKLFVQHESTPSEYLAQMDIAQPSWCESRKRNNETTKPASALLDSSLQQKRGNLCFHTSFGVGVVEHVLGGNKLIVQFASDEPGRIRTLSADFVQICNQKASAHIPTPSEIEHVKKLFAQG